METVSPVAIIQPEAGETVSSEASVPVAPLARGIIRGTVELGVAFAREVIEPELAQKQEKYQAQNQQELLAELEIAALLAEQECLEAQSPRHIIQSFLTEEAIRKDLEQMAAVRSELADLTSMSTKAVSMEPHTFVQQQEMGIKSAIGMPERSIDAVRAELCEITQSVPVASE